MATGIARITILLIHWINEAAMFLRKSITWD
uniref:Uncharacterized protein n=1 Tax=Anguilla anguilla TaxID=7936 RepID=A0A0E9TL97_ANGAN